MTRYLRFLKMLSIFGAILSAFALSHSAKHYLGLGTSIGAVEAMASTTHDPFLDSLKTMLGNEPGGDAALSIVRTRSETFDIVQSGWLTSLRQWREAALVECLLWSFAFFFSSTSLLLVDRAQRHASSNKALQSDVPRPAGAGRG